MLHWTARLWDGCAVFRALAYAATLALLAGCSGVQDDTIRLVGSSTVFPFAARAAERHSEETGARIVVEQTGSGGGHKLICAGPDGPDATTSSRRQDAVEAHACRANGVGDLLELELGYDGIVLARAAGEGMDGLTRAQIYRALAAELPDAQCRYVPNPNRIWSDISAALPSAPIVVHGPPPTSGTRDAFVQLVMEAGARGEPCGRSLAQSDPSRFAALARTLREDGAWVDAGENDNALVRTLIGASDSLGVMGFAVVDRNRAQLQGLAVDGVAPDRAAILSGDYPVVRTLYAYFREDRIRQRPALAGLASAMTADTPSAEIIALPVARRAEMQARLDEVLGEAAP